MPRKEKSKINQRKSKKGMRKKILFPVQELKKKKQQTKKIKKNKSEKNLRKY